MKTIYLQVICSGGVVREVKCDRELDIEIEVIDLDDCDTDQEDELNLLPVVLY